MSNELEALEILKKHNSKSTSERYYYPVNTRRNAVNIIEQALQRLEAIDNANPSEALESVERLNQTISLAENFYDSVYEDKDIFVAVQRDVDTIKQALIKSQEQEKVLSILKEKRIDLESFCITFIENDYDYNYYEKMYGTYGKYKLTQEEFDLLKRYCNEKNL